MKLNLNKGLLSKATLLIVITLILLAIPAVALADGPTVESNAVALDTVWVLVTGFLVFFMQAGFAMVETGFTRAKNAGNIIMKNLMDFAVGSLIYWAIGFAIMFGVDYAELFGTTGFGTTGTFEHLGLSIPIWAFLLFQTVFAATAATIVSGASSVHGVCGASGTAMVGFFAVDGGLLYGGGVALLITQIIGIASVFAWTAGTALILFGIIKVTIGLRVTAEEELIGLDIGEHGMEAYAGFEMKAPSVNL